MRIITTYNEVTCNLNVFIYDLYRKRNTSLQIVDKIFNHGISKIDFLTYIEKMTGVVYLYAQSNLSIELESITIKVTDGSRRSNDFLR